MNKNLLNLLCVIVVIVLICLVINMANSNESKNNTIILVHGPTNNYIEVKVSIGKIESDKTVIGDNNKIIEEGENV